MRKLLPLLLSAAFLFSAANGLAQDPLPKGMTEEEKSIYQEYLETRPEPRNTQPPANPPRTPGEYEEVQGVIITWAGYSAELREIVRHARPSAKVYIITSNIGQVQTYLTNGGVPLENIEFVQAPFNSVWVRDYGPQSIYLEEEDELAFVDWDYNRPRPEDNQIPQFMAGYLNVPIFQLAHQSSLLTATGGNFMADGHGTGFSSKLILSENPGFTEGQIDQVMYDFKGIDRYIKMDELPYDNISHLDMHMKLLDEETLLVGEFPEGVSDGPYIEANLDYLLSNYNTCYDRPYQVVRIPMAPSTSGNYPPNAYYRTYTNSVILNDVVLVPIYGSYLDSDAIEIYEEAMPGYNIVGIDMNGVISASGAIHCVTREIAAEDPIFIAHAPIRETHHRSEGFEIAAHIRNHSGIDQAEVFWSLDPDQGFNSLSMTLQEDTFYAHIPAQLCETEIFYYLSATNNNNKTITKPLVAPGGYYSFTVDGDATHFYAEPTSVEVGETVTFTLDYCQEPDEVSWDFGQDSEPATAEGIGPHEVIYNQAGAKTITMNYDGETLVKEDYILVNDSDTFLLAIRTEGNGTTQPEPGDYSYEAGEEVQLIAYEDEGWEFVEWVVNEQESHYSSTLHLEMEENTLATAVFQEIGTSIPLVEKPFRFNIFPNPTDGLLNISLSPSAKPVEIMVSDLHGQVMFRDIFPVSGVEIQKTLNLNHLSSGVYVIRLSDGWQVKTGKVVVR